MLDLDLIRIDGDTQTRMELDQSTVDAYADAYLAGAVFPPVAVFFDGKDRWLADGFHRYFAAKKAGKTSILESITPGTKRDAILFSLGANGKHGKPPSNADKRNAVKRMLGDAEWSEWSDNAIAKACHVSQPFVSGIRSSLITVISEELKERTYTTKHGTVATMRTADIGKSEAPDASPEYTDLDRANDTISEIAEVNDRLSDRLAIAAFDATDEEKEAAANTIAELRKENKNLLINLKAVTQSRDQTMEENTQLKRQCLAQRREIDNLKNGL